jgi:hypothetical protein
MACLSAVCRMSFVIFVRASCARDVRIDEFSRRCWWGRRTPMPMVLHSGCAGSAAVSCFRCRRHGRETTAVHFRIFIRRITPSCREYRRGASIGHSGCVRFSVSDDQTVSDESHCSSICPRNCLHSTTARCCRFSTSPENSFEDSGHARNCSWNRFSRFKVL